MLGSATAVAGLGPNAAVAKPTNTLMTIAEEGSLEVDADVNAVDMGGVFTGQEAKFTLDAYQGKVFSGKVKSIALQPTVMNGVTTYRVILAVATPAQEFRIGMPSNIMLFRTIVKTAFLVPPASILKEGSRAFLFTVEKDSSPDRMHVRKRKCRFWEKRLPPLPFAASSARQRASWQRPTLNLRTSFPSLRISRKTSSSRIPIFPIFNSNGRPPPRSTRFRQFPDHSPKTFSSDF
jgi:Barrel-sandwich domain of CusB or HlyD membrane-fusion